MTPDKAQVYLVWLWIGMSAVTILLLLLTAVRASRPRIVRTGAQLFIAALSIIAAVLVVRITGVSLAALPAGVVVLVGLIAGVLLGRSAPLGAYKGRVVVKPSALGAWLSAVAWMIATAALAFAGPNTISTAMMLVVGTIVMGLTETVMHVSRARNVVRDSTAAGATEA